MQPQLSLLQGEYAQRNRLKLLDVRFRQGSILKTQSGNETLGDFQAEVTRQHGLLVSFGRSCAEYCTPNCVTKGFGIVRETCIYCCTNDASCREDIEEKTKAVQPRSASTQRRRNSTSLLNSSACRLVGKPTLQTLALFAAIFTTFI